MLNIILEILHDRRVCVKLHHTRIDFRVPSGCVDIDAPEAKEVVFPTMVIIVVVDQGSEDPEPMFPCLVNRPVNRVERLLVVDT